MLIALLMLCKLLTVQEWLVAGLCPCWCQRGKSSSHLFKSLAEWRGSWASGWKYRQKRLVIDKGRKDEESDEYQAGWSKASVKEVEGNHCCVGEVSFRYSRTTVELIHNDVFTMLHQSFGNSCFIGFILASWVGWLATVSAKHKLGVRAIQMLLMSMQCLIPSQDNSSLLSENRLLCTCRVVKPLQSIVYVKERFYYFLSITQRISRQLCFSSCSGIDWHRFISADTAWFCYHAE